MPRPLMQHGVGQLEEMFAKSKTDPKVLRSLKSELSYRQVPRAVALLAEVEDALNGVAPVPAVTPTVPITPPFEPIQKTAQPARPLDPISTRRELPPPSMPLEDAYKTLKSSPGASWESIEQSRRLLVQQSHPSRLEKQTAARRAEILAEAKRINAAYATLSHARCG